MDQHKMGVIELHIRLERMLQTAYKLFSDSFIRDFDLWDRLAEEEGKHSAWLGIIMEGVKSGDTQVALEPEVQSNLGKTLRETRVLLEKARQKGYTRKEALDTALKLEYTLAERHVFDHFVPSTKKQEEVLDLLRAEVQTHIDIIEERIAEVESGALL